MSFTGNRPNILIVDDEEKICILIKAFLEKTNLFGNIVIATSVTVGLMKYRNENFDLVIVDYNMPNKNGVEFVDMITNSISGKKTRVLLISGYLDHQAMSKAVSKGIRNILVKPFNRLALVDKVMAILKMQN